MRHTQEGPSRPTQLSNASSSRSGVPGGKWKGSPCPLFSLHCIQDRDIPQQRYVWPKLGWGAGEAERPRGEMCGGLLSLPFPPPPPLRSNSQTGGRARQL